MQKKKITIVSETAFSFVCTDFALYVNTLGGLGSASDISHKDDDALKQVSNHIHTTTVTHVTHHTVHALIVSPLSPSFRFRAYTTSIIDIRSRETRQETDWRKGAEYDPEDSSCLPKMQLPAMISTKKTDPLMLD